MVFKVPIGIRSTNWYSKYQLVVEVPIGSWSTNRCTFHTENNFNVKMFLFLGLSTVPMQGYNDLVDYNLNMAKGTTLKGWGTTPKWTTTSTAPHGQHQRVEVQRQIGLQPQQRHGDNAKGPTYNATEAQCHSGLQHQQRHGDNSASDDSASAKASATASGNNIFTTLVDSISNIVKTKNIF
jgi:hypothetical protein